MRKKAAYDPIIDDKFKTLKGANKKASDDVKKAASTVYEACLKKTEKGKSRDKRS